MPMKSRKRRRLCPEPPRRPPGLLSPRRREGGANSMKHAGGRFSFWGRRLVFGRLRVRRDVAGRGLICRENLISPGATGVIGPTSGLFLKYGA
jgi:hypothetical protein